MAGLTKLQKAAVVALKDYMGISSEETLLVVSDEKLREIGLTLFEAGKELSHEAIYVEMKPREINGQEPPDQITELMKAVDVVVCPTSKSLTHTNARREASKLGVRIGTMPGITEETMLRCFSADYQKIVTTSELVNDKLKKANSIRVTSKLGTDVTMSVKARKSIISTGVLRKIGESGNLPSGEVYLAPWEGKTNGKVVFDGSFAGIGLLEKPVIIEINKGYGTVVSDSEQSMKIVEMFEKAGKDANAVAEFGIGTNYKAKLCGEILEDEKVLGTIHIAFGNNLSMGGKISVSSHLDGLVKKPTVYVDDEMIMKDGKLTIE